MTHQRDLDRVLDRWMDDGPSVVADRVIAAAMTDVHTTRQIGVRWAPLKELFMNMKPATTLLALALIATLGIAAYQLIWTGGNIASPPEPRIVAASELPEIVMDADEAPAGMNLDGIYTEGNDVLVRPIISVTGSDAAAYLQQPGFLAGRYSEFSDVELNVILSWAALFETPADAERALALYVDEVQSEAGYGLGRRTEVDLGDEGAHYDDEDPEDDAKVYLWRVGNLVLAAATIGDYDPDLMRSVAEGMDDRAR